MDAKIIKSIDPKIITFTLVMLTLIFTLFAIHSYRSVEFNEIRKTKQSVVNKCAETKSKLEYVKTRDFMSYECKNIRRIGGPNDYQKNAPHPLYRIDGAWYVCMDENVAPKYDDCIILSFGINTDYSFDIEMNRDYGCSVFSYDPVVEADIFSKIRASNKDLAESFEIRVNPKWVFYRLGLTGNTDYNDVKSLKHGNVAHINALLKLSKLENKVIDVFKMDIEGPERGVIDNLDMSYACKYIKQLLIETHKNFEFRDLVKLEECFLLFKRDTRFFEYTTFDGSRGPLSEFQAPNGYDLKLQTYFNETYLAEFMFVNGELYFVNRNFINFH